VADDADCDGILTAADCNDSDANVYPYAGDAYGDGIDSDCDGMDCEAESYGGTYFVVCSESGYSNADYESRCVSAGYDGLASIRDSGEQAFVEGLITNAGPSNFNLQDSAYYIGYNTASGAFSDGHIATYANWYPGEPSGDGPCAAMNWHVLGLWNDLACSWSTGGGICQLR